MNERDSMYSLYKRCPRRLSSVTLVRLLLFIVLWASLGIIFQLTSPSLYPINSAQQHTFLNFFNRRHFLWGNHSQSEDNSDALVNTIWSIQQNNQQIFQQQYDLNGELEKSRSDDSSTTFSASWPCLWGMEAITTSNEEAAVQWGCGIGYLQEHRNEHCVVYSFRSQHQGGQIELELRISELLSVCGVHIFVSDAADNDIVIDSVGGRVTMHHWNGGESLSNIMDGLGHSHLDILNVNIEREQIPIFFALNSERHWPSIGQMNLRMNDPAPRPVIKYLEDQSLRIYNVGNNRHGMTFAFIQKEWSPNNRQYIGLRSMTEPTGHSETMTVLEVESDAAVQEVQPRRLQPIDLDEAIQHQIRKSLVETPNSSSSSSSSDSASSHSLDGDSPLSTQSPIQKPIDFCRSLIGSPALEIRVNDDIESEDRWNRVSRHLLYETHPEHQDYVLPDFCSGEKYLYKDCGFATATKQYHESSTSDGDIYWVKNFDLNIFVQETLPQIHHYFTLIYVNSLAITSPVSWDADPRIKSDTAHFFEDILQNRFLLFLFLENYDGTLTKYLDDGHDATNHPIVSPLPIGLSFHDGPGIHEQQYLCVKQVVEHRVKPFNLDDRTLKIFVDSALRSRFPSFLKDWDSMFGRNWTPNLGYSTKWDPQSADLLRLYLIPKWERKFYFRHWALWNIEENENVDHELFHVDTSHISKYEILEKRSGFVFSLSLFGTGMDCHRTYDALLASNIVIVIESPLDILYQQYNLPVVSVRSFEDITEDKLREWYHLYKDSVFMNSAETRYRMTNGFWTEYIQTVTQQKVQRIHDLQK